MKSKDNPSNYYSKVTYDEIVNAGLDTIVFVIDDQFKYYNEINEIIKSKFSDNYRFNKKKHKPDLLKGELRIANNRDKSGFRKIYKLTSDEAERVLVLANPIAPYKMFNLTISTIHISINLSKIDSGTLNDLIYFLIDTFGAKITRELLIWSKINRVDLYLDIKANYENIRGRIDRKGISHASGRLAGSFTLGGRPRIISVYEKRKKEDGMKFGKVVRIEERLFRDKNPFINFYRLEDLRHFESFKDVQLWNLDEKKWNQIIQNNGHLKDFNEIRTERGFVTARTFANQGKNFTKTYLSKWKTVSETVVLNNFFQKRFHESNDLKQIFLKILHGFESSDDDIEDAVRRKMFLSD